jgi:hypothetical protein
VFKSARRDKLLIVLWVLLIVAVVFLVFRTMRGINLPGTVPSVVILATGEPRSGAV